MTNLQRWLLYLVLFLVPYFGILAKAIKTQGMENLLLPLQLAPYVLVIAFGLYAAGTVLYRTFTFNDCPAAAKELQDHIHEARKDLLSKGFIFRD
ncbi:dolichol-phosphate mannosyltransferase subunit 3 [Stomoxys calcitrans]|uniref:Dolichol-phosphate mannosyltransferase subunit 3 n=1 Tax=Stomoxys calcitrans TaxID=35570 RepID=A0A1I8P7U0_STOCA|nr:dolichol-phosphate mannosyltransferase subunit 3 [Stomoxys calcitrans]